MKKNKKEEEGEGEWGMSEVTLTCPPYVTTIPFISRVNCRVNSNVLIVLNVLIVSSLSFKWTCN
jgi:hypothetical protein